MTEITRRLAKKITFEFDDGSSVTMEDQDMSMTWETEYDHIFDDYAYQPRRVITNTILTIKIFNPEGKWRLKYLDKEDTE